MQRNHSTNYICIVLYIHSTYTALFLIYFFTFKHVLHTFRHSLNHWFSTLVLGTQRGAHVFFLSYTPDSNYRSLMMSWSFDSGVQCYGKDRTVHSFGSPGPGLRTPALNVCVYVYTYIKKVHAFLNVYMCTYMRTHSCLFIHISLHAYIFSLQDFVFQAVRCGASVQSSVLL